MPQKTGNPSILCAECRHGGASASVVANIDDITYLKDEGTIIIYHPSHTSENLYQRPCNGFRLNTVPGLELQLFHNESLYEFVLATALLGRDRVGCW